MRRSVAATAGTLLVVASLAGPARAHVEYVTRWPGVVPVDPGLWVVGAGLVELAVGVALVFGVFTRPTAAVGFLTLTLFGLPDDPVLAHVTLFGLTSVLFVTGGGPYSVDRWLARRRRGTGPEA